MSSLGIDAARLTLSGSSLTGVSAISRLSNPTQPGATNAPTSGVSDTDGDAATTRVSKQAQFLNKLKRLQQSDPAKFKQILTDVATALQAAAKTATGTQQQNLTSLAAKFTQAANGNLSALHPPQPPANATAAAYAQNAPDAGSPLASASPKSGGHHHHHGGADGSQSSAVAQAFQELSAALDAIPSTSSSTAGTTAANAAALNSVTTGKTASALS